MMEAGAQFFESTKVFDLLQRPFLQLPMASDLPRLLNMRVVDEKGSCHNHPQPSSSDPTLVKLRYTFVALTSLILDETAADITAEMFDHHFKEGMDVTKIQMETFLEKMGGDDSPVVQVLKAVNQSAISPAIIHLKLKLGLVNMTKDVRDSWFYELIVSKSSGQVVVASHKRDQSIKNEFQFEWVMAVHFDKHMKENFPQNDDAAGDEEDEKSKIINIQDSPDSDPQSIPMESKEDQSSHHNNSNRLNTQKDDVDQEEVGNHSTKNENDSKEDHSDSKPHHTSNADSDVVHSTNSSGNHGEHDISTQQQPQEPGNQQLKILRQKFDHFYKCTNVSLKVTDIMYSLALHTMHQDKRQQIASILEGYATPDVMQSGMTRHWEFYPASSASSTLYDSSVNHNTTTTTNSTNSETIPGASLTYASGAASDSTSPSQASTPSTNHPTSIISPSNTPSNPNESPTKPKQIVQGIKAYDNGDIYEGGLFNGIREGTGSYKGSNGLIVYEGGYKDGKRHGKGKFSFQHGAVLHGEFQRGFVVHGTYVFSNGDIYEGDFKDDKFDGQGKWRCKENGDDYEGSWKSGLRHGRGMAHIRQGDTYDGEFLNDLMHGFGKYYFKNGDFFNGQFAAGQIHGVGEYTFSASGKTLLGEFAHGKLIKASSITNPSKPSQINTTNNNNSGQNSVSLNNSHDSHNTPSLNSSSNNSATVDS